MGAQAPAGSRRVTAGPRKRAFSGIQPTGKVHLGNLLGAIQNWVAQQDSFDCTFCIVDYHAMTVEYDAATLEQRIFDLAVALLACGIDPARSTLFVQSDVPEHTELAWMLVTLAPVSRLELQTQYKDKIAQNAQNVNAGILIYPVLQAADILIHRADVVPVGDDQAQHLELSRELARKFNNRFGQTFVEPETVLTKSARIVGLDGEHKMSKSRENTLDLLATPEELWDKLRGAKTDPQRLRRADPGRPECCNIYSLHGFLSTADEVAAVARDCRTAAIGCVDCKKILHKNLVALLDPIRARAEALYREPDRVWEILREGGAKARAEAQKTMAAARAKCGLTRK
jgi:tryptophanyl-tRNA synthetase